MKNRWLEPEPAIPKTQSLLESVRLHRLNRSRLVEQPEVAPTPEFVEGDLDEMRSYVQNNDGDYAARLSLARALWKAGVVDEAMENYALLVQANAEIPNVMADLRQAAEERPEDTTVLQTLGDAYMAQGLVDQALEIYNRAMNLL